MGTAPKLASHHANTPLHLAFSCYIFNRQGKFLLTQRAHSKKVWPGVWTNSVCGHLLPGETTRDAVRRRAKFELGLTLDKVVAMLPDYRYKTPPFEGIIENEICPVFAAVAAAEPKPNSEEVEAYKWIGWDELANAIQKNSDKYSYWFKDQLQCLAKSAEFSAFISNS